MYSGAFGRVQSCILSQCEILKSEMSTSQVSFARQRLNFVAHNSSDRIITSRYLSLRFKRCLIFIKTPLFSFGIYKNWNRMKLTIKLTSWQINYCCWNWIGFKWYGQFCTYLLNFNYLTDVMSTTWISISI